MRLEHSIHWKLKAQERPNISDDSILYAIGHSRIMRDKRWPDAFNAVARVPPMGRMLKVVYRRLGKNEVKIITAFWLD